LYTTGVHPYSGYTPRIQSDSRKKNQEKKGIRDIYLSTFEFESSRPGRKETKGKITKERQKRKPRNDETKG
jgi:hypothetical protein